MTTGALIFAFNNEETDYVKLAAWSAKNIRRHLNIPVAVVTNVEPAPGLFDQVIITGAESGGTRYFEDYNQTVTWHNAGRVNAYELTPWDKTLVLDADYVVACDDLKQVFNVDTDFLCHKNAYNIATGAPMHGLNTFGNFDYPMWWATVMFFRKSPTAQYIFDSMQMIKNNWDHYRQLYGIDRSTYRNDFALSIALGIVSGHTNCVDEIPWPLFSLMPDAKFEQDGQDMYNIHYTDSFGKKKFIGWGNADLHAMGKRHLEAIIAAN